MVLHFSITHTGVGMHTHTRTFTHTQKNIGTPQWMPKNCHVAIVHIWDLTCSRVILLSWTKHGCGWTGLIQRIVCGPTMTPVLWSACQSASAAVVTFMSVSVRLSIKSPCKSECRSWEFFVFFSCESGSVKLLFFLYLIIYCFHEASARRH